MELRYQIITLLLSVKLDVSIIQVKCEQSEDWYMLTDSYLKDVASIKSKIARLEKLKSYDEFINQHIN